MSDSREIQPVFIVGCPRSGSTWMTLLLSQHPEIAAFQQLPLQNDGVDLTSVANVFERIGPQK